MFSFYWETWFEEVKKNPFVVLGVHIFSGVTPRALFVPSALKKMEEKGAKKKPERNNSPKVKTDSADNRSDKDINQAR